MPGTSADSTCAIATHRDPYFSGRTPWSATAQQASMGIQVRANVRVLIAAERGDMFALVAHTLRQNAIGTSTGCPYAWSLAMAIPSQLSVGTVRSCSSS
ncbi:hypothetical protein [Burkholderia sp. PAMC 26561]|uniref:hypothetical protein n=1 Tax=Burkholderia sp. PAMC 26561 TaxID=1795043 RepID=UPI00076B29AD|nr:hypothetical protein [Burkholderia sp. PAMC 26561]AME27371.2 hypothetical protein AXG89_26210 [Burkholderia sp. PAMC 26561]